MGSSHALFLAPTFIIANTIMYALRHDMDILGLLALHHPARMSGICGLFPLIFRVLITQVHTST